MKLHHQKITIRPATAADAAQLAAWWNDGSVMAHAGFPNGLGTTAEKIARDLERDSENTRMRLILEWYGTPIGEMSYQDVSGAADIGIKICNAEYQEQGIGRVALSMLIRHLFQIGFPKIVLDTNLKNLRAQHVYEKLGFRKVAVHMDSWTNQLGKLESAVEYVLTETDFVDFS